MADSPAEAHANAVRALHEDLLIRYPGEAAERLERLDIAEIAAVAQAHPLELTLPVWARLAPDIAARVLEAVDAASAAAVLARLEPNRSALYLSGLPAERRAALLARLPGAVARDIETVLSYPPDRAGALMDPRAFSFRAHTSVEAALARLRARPSQRVRMVFLVDSEGRLQGSVDVQDLALATAATALQALAASTTPRVDGMATREEVVERLEQGRLTDLPVVDFDRRLIGVVRYHTWVEAAREEASAGLQTMVGASKEERALSGAGFAVRKRLPWLQINLATAFLAASVVGLFESTIARYTALAVLLPVVAGQSGNTGAQALAVTMRGLALREIRTTQWPRVLVKEVNAGLLNGLAVAFTTCLGVLVWSGSVGLTAVIGVSMVISMVVAGAAGAAIPIVLTLAGQDPAQSSSIVLTTITDVAGFFSFLGIATLMSGFL